MMVDWRGAPIRKGDRVIYGAGWGSHSIKMVEAEVIEFKPNGRVVVQPIRDTLNGPLRRKHVDAKGAISIRPATPVVITITENLTLIKRALG